MGSDITIKPSPEEARAELENLRRIVLYDRNGCGALLQDALTPTKAEDDE